MVTVVRESGDFRYELAEPGTNRYQLSFRVLHRYVLACRETAPLSIRRTRRGPIRVHPPLSALELRFSLLLEIGANCASTLARLGGATAKIARPSRANKPSAKGF